MSFLLIAVEAWVKQWVAVSGLLAVVSMACVLKVKSVGCVTKRLSDKFGKLWIAAEVILFVLVGAAVDIRYALSAGIAAVGMILIALAFRAVGVTVCLIGTPLTFKERLFLHHCVSSEGNCAGGDLLCTARHGAFLRKHCRRGNPNT